MVEQVNCYICLEKIEEPQYPAGCTHGLCKKHLKVSSIIKKCYLYFR